MIAVRRLSLALLVAASGSVFAAGSADSVSVVDPYVRLLPPGAKATAAFMLLKNAGDADAKLVKAESAAARKVELHTHLNEGGVMKMRPVEAIDIKAKGETALKPGSFHLMMIEPTAGMKEGDKIAVTLGFGDGSSKNIEAVVRKPVATPAAMDHSAHEHKH